MPPNRASFQPRPHSHAPLIQARPGNNLIALNNRNTYIQIEPQKFNAYLQEDGLDNALEWRKTHSLLNRPGRENYQRCVKTLIRNGSQGDDTYALNTGMRLELIPSSDPYDKPRSLEFTVLFDNKPLENALVQVWHRAGGRTTVDKLRSDNAGKVTFPLWPDGDWMISAVRIVPTTPSKTKTTNKADWQSYWGSYTFSYR